MPGTTVGGRTLFSVYPPGIQESLRLLPNTQQSHAEERLLSADISMRSDVN